MGSNPAFLAQPGCGWHRHCPAEEVCRFQHALCTHSRSTDAKRARSWHFLRHSMWLPSDSKKRVEPCSPVGLLQRIRAEP